MTNGVLLLNCSFDTFFEVMVLPDEVIFYPNNSHLSKTMLHNSTTDKRIHKIYETHIQIFGIGSTH